MFHSIRKASAHRCLALAAVVATCEPAGAWVPGTPSPAAVSGFVVDSSDRRDVLAFYNCIYPASENYASNIGWTGNIATGSAGTTTASFKDDVRRRVNFFRALAGLPADITFHATKSAKAQEAALMMSANNALSHYPPSHWLWYTANAYEAAAKSNLAIGLYGPGAVTSYIRDPGAGNHVVGHRRWILYSRAQEMGSGDVPPNGSYRGTNVLWVINDFKPAPAPQFIAWPNAGYLPHPLMPERWSLSYPGASFSTATVTMTQGGTNVPLTVVSKTDTGIGDNTIVWEPTGLPTALTSDVPYVVTVSGIGGGGPTSKTYTVTLFNPDVLGESVTITGTSTPPTTGYTYHFNGIAQADQYQLEVATNSTAAWTEGAEDSPAPMVTEAISPGYSLRQTGLRRTGAKGFQLTFPPAVWSDQSFTVTRDIIPGAASQLKYYDRAKYSLSNNTLETQVSADNGLNWTTVASRTGVSAAGGYAYSTDWDANWISRSVSLAAYAGQTIRLRFLLKSNGAAPQGTTSDFGFFIDDVTVTNATHLTNTTTTLLPGGASSFVLDATTAGAPLSSATGYSMRVRPNVGTRWFGFGSLKNVTTLSVTGYAAWVLADYPMVTGGFTADHENDGIPNGVEYAFGLNPTRPDGAASLPQPVLAGGNLTLSYNQPPGVTGITYGAEWSYHLTDWNPVTDTGSGSSHLFSVSTADKPALFLRHKITQGN